MGPETPENFTFGGGASGTVLHPIMLAALLIALLAIFFAPRRFVPAAFLSVIFLGSVGQQIYVAGFHFYILRILVLGGIVRLVGASFMSSETPLAGGLNTVDKLFVLWVTCRCLADILLNHCATGAITYQTGFFIDCVGGYCFLRYLIRDENDVLRVIRIFAVFTCIFAVTMLDEKFHSQNIFGYLGVLPVVPAVREGSIRAMGAFAHPILAGVFGVALMPLFWWLWRSGKSKKAGICGFLGSLAMMLMSASSTPLMALLGAVVAWFAWPFRNRMRLLRWSLVVTLIGLHLVMKAPVWMLISRVDLIAGNSGYHRAMLIDMCIRHFSDWWLIGTNAAGTWGWDLWDTSNQFVQEAESGGLITFVLFVLIISKCFRRLAVARNIAQDSPEQQRFMWALTVTLFTNCVCFFGISYFDHTKIMWFTFLAIVAAVTGPIIATQTDSGHLERRQTLIPSPPFREPRYARAGASTTQKHLLPSHTHLSSRCSS